MTYRAVQVAEPGAPLTGVDVPVREPGSGQVRVKVQACGICHTDSDFVNGSQPGLTYLVTPGHEVAGVIEALGSHVPGPPSGLKPDRSTRRIRPRTLSKIRST
jgi:alcohol dehydrogenase